MMFYLWYLNSRLLLAHYIHWPPKVPERNKKGTMPSIEMPKTTSFFTASGLVLRSDKRKAPRHQARPSIAPRTCSKPKMTD